jgi:DNA polymerase/3'-5' exonuclease PolX
MRPELDQIRERCPAVYHDFAVLLYMAASQPIATWAYTGSFRRGDYTEASDVDLMIEDGSAFADLFRQAVALQTWDHRDPPAQSHGAIARSRPEIDPYFLQGRSGAKADVMIVDPVYWGSALVWFTGPREVNRELEECAYRTGLLYRGGLLYRSDEKIECRDELLLFNAVGVPFLSVKERRLRAASTR